MKILKKLLACIFFLGFGVATFFPTLPMFYRAFMPFPKLEEAIVYTGTLSVVGEERCIRGRCSEPNYYVTDATGKHEIYFGLPGGRRYPYSIANENAGVGSFWLHPKFGVLQHDYQFQGYRIHSNYEHAKKEYEENFPYKKIWPKTIPFLIFIIVLLSKFKSIFLD